VQFGTALGLRCDHLEQRLAPTLLSSKGQLEEMLRHARTPYELGVPIYPNGDPRAKMLIELALGVWTTSGGAKATAPIEPVPQDHFILDEGLVVLCRALGVQQQAAGGLLALGRTAGWIAHILEQRGEQFVIRPRGKFVPGPVS
jgi:citrate synthase